MFLSKKKNVPTDKYVGRKLIYIKNIIKKNKTLVTLCVLGGIYYAVNQYIL